MHRSPIGLTLRERRVAAHGLVLASAAGTAVATLLPWPSAGRTEYNGFDFARHLSDLGRNLDEPVVRLVAALWFLVPLSAGVAVLLLALDRRSACVAALVMHVGALAPAAGTWWAVGRVHLDAHVGGPALAACTAVLGIVGVCLRWALVRRPAHLASP